MVGWWGFPVSPKGKKMSDHDNHIKQIARSRTIDAHIRQMVNDATDEEKEIIENERFNAGQLYSFFYDEGLRKLYLEEYKYNKLMDAVDFTDSLAVKKYDCFFTSEELIDLDKKIKEINQYTKMQTII